MKTKLTVCLVILAATLAPLGASAVTGLEYYENGTSLNGTSLNLSGTNGTSLNLGGVNGTSNSGATIDLNSLRLVRAAIRH